MTSEHNFIMLGERIEEMMVEKGFDPKDIANALGVDVSIVYTWIRNQNIPAFENIVGLADLFKCSLDFLAGLSDDDKQSSIYKKCPPFGERLRFVLKKENKTEYRIAKDTKISRNSFFDWFTGKSLPSLESLIRLAKYLEYTIDELVGREG